MHSPGIWFKHFSARFSGAERHRRRLAKVAKLEDETGRQGVEKFNKPFDKLMESLTQTVTAAFNERVMKVSPFAGKPAEPAMLVNVPQTCHGLLYRNA